jgi:hypothetical protein
MLAEGFGEMQSGEVGPYYRSADFAFGRAEKYVVGGQQQVTLQNGRIDLIDSEWGFRLNFVNNGYVREVVGVTSDSSNQLLDVALQHPDSIVSMSSRAAGILFSRNSTMRRLYSDDGVPSWWCDILERQSALGVNIFRQVAAAMGDSEYNPDLQYTRVSERLMAELGLGVAA